MIRAKNSQAGFTLIQLSIILTVAALMMAAVLPGFNANTDAQRITVQKMNAIMNALRQYQVANGTLPCPASAKYNLSYASSGLTFGESYGSKASTCVPSGSTDYGDNFIYENSAKTEVIGIVPVATLGLPYDAGIDGWGRFISYAMDLSALSPPTAQAPNWTGSLSVSDNNINNYTSAVLVSHGPDGFGAWIPQQGTGTCSSVGTTYCRNYGGAPSPNQLLNAQMTYSGSISNGAYTGGSFSTNVDGYFSTFVRSTPNYSTNQANYFDDIVMYANPQWSLQVQPTTTSTYLNGSTSSNYKYVRVISINESQVGLSANAPVTLTEFPMLLSSTIPDLRTVSNGGKIQFSGSSGFEAAPLDLMFSTDAFGQNPIPFEVTYWNPATGQIVAWIGIPTLYYNATGTQPIYMWYGNPTVTSYQGGPWSSPCSSCSGVGSFVVGGVPLWSVAYRSVYHLISPYTLQFDSTYQGANFGWAYAVNPTTFASASIVAPYGPGNMPYAAGGSTSTNTIAAGDAAGGFSTATGGVYSINEQYIDSSFKNTNFSFSVWFRETCCIAPVSGVIFEHGYLLYTGASNPGTVTASTGNTVTASTVSGHAPPSGFSIGITNGGGVAGVYYGPYMAAGTNANVATWAESTYASDVTWNHTMTVDNSHSIADYSCLANDIYISMNGLSNLTNTKSNFQYATYCFPSGLTADGKWHYLVIDYCDSTTVGAGKCFAGSGGGEEFPLYVFLDGTQLGNYTVSSVVQPSYWNSTGMTGTPSFPVTESSYYGATYAYNDDEEIGFGEGSYFTGNLSELRFTKQLNPYDKAGASGLTGCTDTNGSNGHNPVNQSCLANWVVTEYNNMAWPDGGTTIPSFISGTTTTPSVGHTNSYGGALPTKGFYTIGPAIQNP